MKFFKTGSIFLLFLLTFSCTTSTQNNESVLSGNVYYLDNNFNAIPVSGALVTAKNFFVQTTTDASGGYSLAVELEATETEKEVNLQVSRVGFSSKEIPVLVKRGQDISVPDITLEKVGGDSSVSPTDTISTSGPASHIEVRPGHDTHVYIQGSGLQESAFLSFSVMDDKGVLVDQEHGVTVHFEILNGPDGGEYLYPETMETQGGKVYTVLNSGILAGAVQIQAWFESEGKTYRTLPVRIAIYGGLPDQNHFSLATAKVNIAGRVHFGITDQVTAFVGDKFSNPVAPGTAVYFSSDYGIVEGSAVTDILGRATVRFMSALPLPPDPANNPFAVITASTFGDTLGTKIIQAQTNLLLSDHTAPIQVTPSSFTYDNSNTPVTFNYTVSDIYNHPIVSESIINVTATDGNLYGDVSLQQVDTQVSGPGKTEFSFTWAPGDSLDAPQVQISITVTTPDDGNGYASTSVVGNKQ